MPEFKNLEDPNYQMTLTEETDFLRYVLTEVGDKEPYCKLADECFPDGVAEGFVRQDLSKCRPKTCPFTTAGGCLYVNACLNEEVSQQSTALFCFSLFPLPL